MKTKENVFVRINSNIEAENAIRVLAALGETNFGNDYSEYSKGLYFNNNLQRWCFATSFGKLVYIEVTLKELIEIIVSEKPKSILDGKVVIQVNNEREFKLLMQHFESKGWILYNGIKPTDQEFSDKCWASYKNRSDFKYREEYLDITVIPFGTFAKEVGIEVPKFIIRSEDGVDFYEDDNYVEATLTCGKWVVLQSDSWKLNIQCRSVAYPQNNKIFYSKKKAQKFCDKMNKPKEIEVLLYFGGKATVKVNSEVTIRDTSYGNITLSHGDVADLQNAINKLK